MSSQNICKFITAPLLSTLSVSCFVRENDPHAIRNGSTLSEHRALLFVEGEGTVVLGGDRLPYRPGTLIFGFRYEKLTVECEDIPVYLYVSFQGARADELFRRFDIRQNNRAFDGFDGLVPLWSESLSRADEQTIDLAAESVLLYTFSRLGGVAEEQNGLIHRILSMSEEQFTDPELSLTTIADKLSYNAKYLSHTFKQKMGMPYSEYLRTLRIKYAVSLFDHGLDSVKNVALLSGFSDPLYFSSVFKKHTGLSPSDYKRRATGEESPPKSP